MRQKARTSTFHTYKMYIAYKGGQAPQILLTAVQGKITGREDTERLTSQKLI